MVLKAGVFPGQSITVGSVGTMNFAIGSATLPNALARAFTLAALQNQPRLAALVPAAAETPEAGPIFKSGIPFHPGAVEAMREFGMHIPSGYAGG